MQRGMSIKSILENKNKHGGPPLFRHYCSSYQYFYQISFSKIANLAVLGQTFYQIKWMKTLDTCSVHENVSFELFSFYFHVLCLYVIFYFCLLQLKMDTQMLSAYSLQKEQMSMPKTKMDIHQSSMLVSISSLFQLIYLMQSPIVFLSLYLTKKWLCYI